MESITRMITCKFCDETYNRFNHVPYLLSCRHSICLRYLTSLDIDSAYFDQDELEFQENEKEVKILCNTCG